MCTFFVMTVLSLILETYEWDTLKDYAKKYENDRDSGTRSLISGINRNYFEPYVMELVFEFTVNANTMIERQIRRMGSIQDDVEETMAGELYADGYIATSQIGDFALLHRLKGAVNNLVMGKAASQGLDQWLFDINKARTPQEIKKIRYQRKTKRSGRKNIVCSGCMFNSGASRNRENNCYCRGNLSIGYTK